jgi:hypothetical protein
VGVAFKGEIIERDGNDRECCDDLHAVEKFGKVCHMVFLRRSIAKGHYSENKCCCQLQPCMLGNIVRHGNN